MIAHDISLYDVILAQEVQVWNALVRGDAQADAGLLADDFVGVYADGFAGKPEHVGQLRDGPTVQSFTIAQVRLITLGPGYCLLTYRADFQRATAKQTEAMYVTSVWILRDDLWVNIFSQDTAAVSV